MFLTRGSKNSLFSVFDFLFNLDCGQWYKFGSPKVFQWVPRRHKLLTHGKSVFFVRSLLCPLILLLNGWTLSPTHCPFSYVLLPADVTVKEENYIRCLAIDIAKYFILLSCRLAMEHLCVLQLDTALATLVTTWFTLADRWWRSRYCWSDQCILNAFMSPELYNGWFREQLGQRFTFFNFFPMMTHNACNFL
jgi:hypothetical protein